MDPQFLIASPQMRDPNFRDSLVLVWHHDEHGARGVVVNRLLDHVLPDVVNLEDAQDDLDAYRDTKVGWGGPVQEEAGIVVTNATLADGEGHAVSTGLSVTGSRDTLVRLLAERAEVLLCVGYAGWSAGQLDQELEEGAWLFTEADPALVFGTPVDRRYDAALASLGLTRHMVWMQPIDE